MDFRHRPIGWKYESYRHKLARQGVKTAKTKSAKTAHREFLIGGAGDNKPDFLFNKRELAKGVKDESEEHTHNKVIAKEIAKDHLAKNPHYYTDHEKFEKKNKRYMAYNKEVELQRELEEAGLAGLTEDEKRKKLAEINLKLDELKYEQEHEGVISRIRPITEASTYKYEKQLLEGEPYVKETKGLFRAIMDDAFKKQDDKPHAAIVRGGKLFEGAVDIKPKAPPRDEVQEYLQEKAARERAEFEKSESDIDRTRRELIRLQGKLVQKEDVQL